MVSKGTAMWLFEYIDYSVSATTKAIACFLISFALVVVYFWDPERRRRKADPSENSILNYVEVDPEELQGRTALLRPKKAKTPLKAQHATLEHLEEYVKELRRFQINNIDDV